MYAMCSCIAGSTKLHWRPPLPLLQQTQKVRPHILRDVCALRKLSGSLRNSRAPEQQHQSEQGGSDRFLSFPHFFSSPVLSLYKCHASPNTQIAASDASLLRSLCLSSVPLSPCPCVDPPLLPPAPPVLVFDAPFPSLPAAQWDRRIYRPALLVPTRSGRSK